MNEAIRQMDNIVELGMVMVNYFATIRLIRCYFNVTFFNYFLFLIKFTHLSFSLNGGYQRLTNFQDLGLSSAWAQRHQEEVKRMAERLQSEFNSAIRSGGGSRFEKFVSSRVSSGGLRKYCFYFYVAFYYCSV